MEASNEIASRSTAQTVLAGLLALLILIFGVLLFVGGMQLAGIGGSWYYALAGAALLATSVFIWKRSSKAIWIYSALMLLSVAWALFESGLQPWSLMPRLVAPACLGLAIAAAVPRQAHESFHAKFSVISISLLAIGLVAVAYLSQGGNATPNHSLSPQSWTDADQSEMSWRYFGGDEGGRRYADAAEINIHNVQELELAWMYRVSGNEIGAASDVATAESTPIEVDGRLYFCTSTNIAIAVASSTGEELWRYDPTVSLDPATHKVCRGVAYHSGDSSNGVCRARILLGTVDNRLLALDANTGKSCKDFGDDGSVDLNEGLGEVPSGYNYVTSPPTILDDTVVIGSFVFDNQSTDEPPGVVRAYDAVSGELLWAWDVLSPSALPALATGETYPRNTPNVWSVASADPDLGLIFLPTGNTPPDFFGGHRTKEQDRYGSSIVAIDVSSGDVRWNYQTVNHDIWDYDIASQPVAVEWKTVGGAVPALLVPTKRGEIFVLDRRTGEPLTEVKQKPVPLGPADGDWLAPTQPYSTGMPSFAPDDLRETSMWGATPLDQLWCRINFRQARYEGQFTPQSTRGSIVYPGAFGIINWGSVSVDPIRNLMMVNTSYLPWYQQLIPRDKADALGIVPWGTKTDREVVPVKGQAIYYAQSGTPYAIDSRPFLSPLGYPCHEPPWGELAAVDLETREILWRRPFGTTRDVAPLGVSLPTGMFNIGGSLVTKGGLTFIAATADNFLRAFSTETGEELWKSRLPAGGQSNPISFVSGDDGRQYIVLAAGGHVPMKTIPGDYLLAFSLPSSVLDATE